MGSNTIWQQSERQRKPATWMERAGLRKHLADGAKPQAGDTEDPVAYTRMSRTPIFRQDGMGTGAGEFHSPDQGNNGFINLPPRVFTNPTLTDLRSIRHESTHAALDPYLDQIAYRMPPQRLKNVGAALATTGTYPEHPDPAETTTELAAYVQDPDHFLGDDEDIDNTMHGAKEELLPAMRAAGVPERLMRHYQQGFAPIGQTAGSVPLAAPEAHGPGRAPGAAVQELRPGPGRGGRRYYGGS